MNLSCIQMRRFGDAGDAVSTFEFAVRASAQVTDLSPVIASGQPEAGGLRSTNTCLDISLAEPVSSSRKFSIEKAELGRRNVL